MTIVRADPEIVLPDDPSFGPEVQVDYPGYRSTALRHPKEPLIALPHRLTEVTGPVFGAGRVGERLGVIARAPRHHAGHLAERRQFVGRAAQLERARALEVLSLQQHPPAAALGQTPRAQHRSTPGETLDGAAGERGLTGADALRHLIARTS